MSHPTDRPVAAWTGRLLFSRENRLPGGAVRMELHNAPTAHRADLVGSTVELRWDPDSRDALMYAESVTTDVTFGEEAKEGAAGGEIVFAERLDGLTAVGPLESLAGFRPEDDCVLVSLPGAVSVVRTESPGEEDSAVVALLIRDAPVQIKGRIKCLVTFVGGTSEEKEAGGTSSERVRVRHYDPDGGGFDGGREEVMAYRDFGATGRLALRRFTFRAIEESAANGEGFYVYGERDDDDDGGLFTIEAIEPRKCLRADRPDEVYLGEEAGTEYIRRLNWRGQVSRKGTVGSVMVDPAANSREEAVSGWEVGDRALVLHLFGGNKGVDGAGKPFNEAVFRPISLVTGHFALGDATVVSCPFADEPVFDIVHRQVYANNADGIVSGPNAWHSYMGDLRRGWLGARPVTDVLIKYPPATRLYAAPPAAPADGEDEEGAAASTAPEAKAAAFDPLGELVRELNEMAARYRTGDGDGAAFVSSESSCVQDSCQALYAALCEAMREGEGDAALGDWVKAHPDEPTARDLSALKALAEDLDRYLTPLGVRRDWRNTAKGLNGMERREGKVWTIMRSLQSWRTMLPRGVQDGLAEIFLSRGAKLWFVRTNQVGGYDDTIYPLAPTMPFHGRDNDDVTDRKCVP